MSEENTATNVENTHEQAEPVAQEAQATAMSVEDYKAALKRANSEAARYRTERNELRKDADAWREQQEAEKSELQKLQEALQAKEAAEQDLRVENTRLRLASKYGIAEEHLDFLGSGSAEEIEDRAQRLAELQAKQVQAPPSNTPKEQLNGALQREDDTPPDAFPASWTL